MTNYIPPLKKPIQIDWTKEEDGLYDETVQVLLRVFQAGGKIGTGQLPASVKQLVDPIGFNRAVQEYLKSYKLDTIKNIADVTRKEAVYTINNWIDAGEPLPVLVERLRPIFGDARAERIAVTEVTRAFAAGNQAAWASTGMVGANKWMTAEDEKVCEICAPLDGIVVPLGDGFTPDGPGEGPTMPPAHVNCRCSLLPVLSMEMIKKQFQDILEQAQ